MKKFFIVHLHIMPFKVRNKTITLKDVATTLTAISTILVLFFGISLTAAIGNIREVLKTPEKIDILLENDSIIYDHIRHADYSHEMVWELFRIMTDDRDTCRWFYADENGIAKNVDIRSTAEYVELAFVFEGHEIYPVFDSPSEIDRKYIIRRNGQREQYMTYLFCRD